MMLLKLSSLHIMPKRILAASVIVLIVLVSALLVLRAETYNNPVAATRERYRPLIGGIQVYNYVIMDYCTTGYVARDSYGRLGIVTAGHCSSFERNVVFFQPTAYPDNEIGRVDIVSRDVDAAFIPTSQVTPSILHITGSGGTYFANIWPVYGYVDFYTLRDQKNVYNLLPFYKTGRTTGTTSGEVERVYESFYFDYLHGYVCYVIETTVHIESSDSGSPLYQISSRGDGVLLFGHFIAYERESPYTYAISITGGENYLGVTPVTGG